MAKRNWRLDHPARSAGETSDLRRSSNADTLEADKSAAGIEHRLSADPNALHRAVSIGAAEGKVEKRLPSDDHGLKCFALRLVPALQLGSFARRKKRSRAGPAFPGPGLTR